MGSQERIIRQKKETASAIIKAAMEILLVDGEDGISMRRIADKIEYTPPIIYCYFKDKHEVLKKLVSIGYKKLNYKIDRSLNADAKLAERMERLILCIVDFALANSKLYKLMSNMALHHPQSLNQMPEIVFFVQKLQNEIINNSAHPVAEEIVQERFYTLMALVNGVISVCFVSPVYIDMGAKTSVKKLVRCALGSDD